ncbi:MAG: hypothetical protein ACRC28_05440 [Clostridium sp.]|uniref:hypothetical protein n=1 Tax=Clostridium sp. TaxID=1506 RepID=UPI003F32DA9F
MRSEIIKIEDIVIKAKENNLDKNILYYKNKVVINESLEDINIENLWEGSIFSKDGEIKIFTLNKGLKAVLHLDEEKDKFIEAESLIREDKFKGYKKVKIKKYLEKDDDGQVFIKYFRAYDLVRGEKENG